MHVIIIAINQKRHLLQCSLGRQWQNILEVSVCLRTMGQKNVCKFDKAGRVYHLLKTFSTLFPVILDVHCFDKVHEQIAVLVFS